MARGVENANESCCYDCCYDYFSNRETRPEFGLQLYYRRTTAVRKIPLCRIVVGRIEWMALAGLSFSLEAGFLSEAIF
jgi:hypothetical protein